MRFAIALLLALLAHDVRAACESTRWLDDFSTPIGTFEGVSPGDLNLWSAGAYQFGQGTANIPGSLFDSRGTFVTAFYLPEPQQNPNAVSRVVIERGGTAPLTCWSGSQLIGATGISDGSTGCRVQWYTDPYAPLPLNGATHWVFVTDHIGIDGRSTITYAGEVQGTVAHGYRNKHTVWTIPMSAAVLAQGNIDTDAAGRLIEWKWEPKSGTGARIPHSRIGLLRIGITDGGGACLPLSTPPEAPFPGTSYGALKEDGDHLVAHEHWQGNGRKCTTCHVPEDGTRLSLNSSIRLATDALYWPLLGEDPAVTSSEAKVLAHPFGFTEPAELLPVPRLLGLAQYGLTPKQTTFGFYGVQDDLDLMNRNAVADHLSFTDARVPGVDFREPTLWELRALTEHIRRAR